MKTSLRLSALLLGLSAVSGTAFANPIVNLNGQNYVQYGDAQSYSLPTLINTQCGGNASSCQYSVDSTPGAIKNLIVMATGTESGPATSNVSGMDDAYSTPSGINGSTYFQNDSFTNRGFTGTINNNWDNTWDASLASLQNFLGGEQMVFFFNNNQINAQQTTQSLAGWAQISITNAAGTVMGVWDLTNRSLNTLNQPGAYALFTEGGGGNFNGDVTTYTSAGLGDPVAGTNTATDYVLSGGAICYTIGGAPINCDSEFAVGQPVNHNLGADHAAYAILFPELNAFLSALFLANPADLADWTFHADVRLGCDPDITDLTICASESLDWGRDLNNGYEQLFIGTASILGCLPNDPTCNPIPEPGTLSLLGLALAALGVTHYRRRRPL